MSWAYVLLRAAIYLIDSTVKKSDFELTALATVDWLFCWKFTGIHIGTYLEWSGYVKFPH